MCVWTLENRTHAWRLGQECVQVVDVCVSRLASKSSPVYDRAPQKTLSRPRSTSRTIPLPTLVRPVQHPHIRQHHHSPTLTLSFSHAFRLGINTALEMNITIRLQVQVQVHGRRRPPYQQYLVSTNR